MKTLRVILTGASGQLGQCIQEEAERFPEIELIATDKETLDVTNQGALELFLRDKPSCLPSVLINCSAYTAVDQAELQSEEAYLLNSFAPAYLAMSCSQLDIIMIHISTDYVFNGETSTPYLEDEEPSPLSVYGKSKAVGEENVFRLLGARSLTVRTSWLYSRYGSNFVKKIITLSRTQDSLRVVDDQIGSPTYAPHLANALLKIALFSCEQGYFPIKAIHYTNSGSCSWYELAREAIDLMGNKACPIQGIRSTELDQVGAPRPKYSVLSHRYTRQIFGLQPPTWQEGLKELANQLNKHEPIQ